jgi:hypothetical protein
MTPATSVCNYAMLRFLPYPETGEFVNVGVLVNCQQPCLLEFQMEQEMPARVKALFPNQDECKFRDAALAMQAEMERVKGMIRDPKASQLAFREAVRPRESVLRFGEVRTILTPEPAALVGDLFRKYVRMETSKGAPLAGV